MMYFTEKDYDITVAWALQKVLHRGKHDTLWETRSICLQATQTWEWVQQGDDYRAVGLGGKTVIEYG